MRKRGGFFRPNVPSSSGMFAKRGNPWVTDREGQRDFDRQVEVENPDMDADRQRQQRIRESHKEFADRAENKIDFRMTMREAIETEKSIRMDSYHQRDKLTKPLFPPKNKWPEKGKDFQVATVQRKCVNIAQRVKREIRALQVEDNSKQAAKIACPRGCGLIATDSRLISKHLQRYRNSCCTHTHCNCPDCRYARNE